MVLVLFASLYPIAAPGQRVGTLQASKDVTLIEKDIAQQLLKEQSAAVVNEALSRDRRVIENTAPEVVNDFKRAGYSSDDATSGLAWSWYWLRVGKGSLPLGEELSANIVQKKATQMGKLVVNSDPDGAAIFVDEAEWPDSTKADGFADVGQRRVRVQKRELQPAETMCDVMRNRVATFSARLLASGSRADCK
jgi:hypothetical protein